MAASAQLPRPPSSGFTLLNTSFSAPSSPVFPPPRWEAPSHLPSKRPAVPRCSPTSLCLAPPYSPLISTKYHLQTLPQPLEMPGTNPSTLHTSTPFLNMTAPSGGIISIPTLQIRKLRHKEMTWLSQGPTGSTRVPAPNRGAAVPLRTLLWLPPPPRSPLASQTPRAEPLANLQTTFHTGRCEDWPGSRLLSPLGLKSPWLRPWGISTSSLY